MSRVLVQLGTWWLRVLALVCIVSSCTVACSRKGSSGSPMGSAPTAYRFPGVTALKANGDGTWTLGWEKVPDDRAEFAIFSRVGGENYDFEKTVAVVTEQEWTTPNLSLKDSTCFVVRFSSPVVKDDRNTTELCTNHERFVFPGLTALERQSNGAYTLRWPVLGGQRASYHVYFNTVTGSAVDYSVPLVILDGGEYTTRVFPLGEVHCFVVRMVGAGLNVDTNTSSKCTGDEVNFEFGGLDAAVAYNGELQCAADASQVATNDLAGSVCTWWTASTHPEVAGFNIYLAKRIKADEARDPFARLVKTVAKDRLGALLVGLEPGATYDVGVRAFDNAAREEKNRRVLSVKVSENVVPRFGGVSAIIPINPDSRGAVRENEVPGTISVAWRPADGFPSGYRIYLGRNELSDSQNHCERFSGLSEAARNAELASACTMAQFTAWEAGECQWLRQEVAQGAVTPECEAARSCFVTQAGFQKLTDETRYSVLVRAVSKSCNPEVPGSCLEDSNTKCMTHVVPDYGAPRFEGLAGVANTLGRVTLYWKKPLGSVAYYEVFKEDLGGMVDECSSPTPISAYNRAFQQIDLVDVKDATESVDGPLYKGMKKAVLSNLGENPAFKVVVRAVDGNKLSDTNTTTRSLCLNDQTPPEFRGFLLARAEGEDTLRIRAQRTTEAAGEDEGIRYRVDVWRIEGSGASRNLIPLVAVTPAPTPLPTPPADSFAVRVVSPPLGVPPADAQTLGQIALGTPLEFTIENLQRAKRYGILVRPIDKSGNASTNTSMAEVETDDVTAPVFTGIKSASYLAAGRKIVLSWDAASDESGIARYLVSGREAGQGSWTWFWNVPGTATGRDILGLPGAKSYEFKVVAQDASPRQNSSTGEVVSAPVYQPQVVSPSFGGIASAAMTPDANRSRDVRIGWVKMPVGQASEYRIYRCEPGATGDCLADGAWTRVAIASADADNVTLSAADASYPMGDHRTYRFRVRAVAKQGSDEFEDRNGVWVQVRIPDQTSPVWSDSRGLLTASLDHSRVAVALTWASASDQPVAGNSGLSVFRVFRREKPAGTFDFNAPFAELPSLKSDGTQLGQATLSGFEQGKDYELALRAVDGAGNYVEGTQRLSVLFATSNPPVARAAVLQGPQFLKTGDTVTCVADLGDLDGDIQSVQFKFKNVTKSAVRSTQTLSASARSATYVLKDYASAGGVVAGADVSGDEMECEAIATDARGNAGSPAAASVTSSKLVVQDSPPQLSVGTPSLLTQTLSAGANVASIPVTLSDADGQTVALEEIAGTDTCDVYTVSGSTISGILPAMGSVASAPAGSGVCAARFVARAGGVRSAGEISVRTTVQNRPPSVPVVTLNPPSPTRADTITCSGGVPTDPDLDPALDVSYSWRVGATWATATVIPTVSGPTLSPAFLASGQKIWCQVFFSDRREGGISSSYASVDVQNRAPTLGAAPSSLVAQPTTTSAGAVVLTGADLDSDTLTFSLYTWKEADAFGDATATNCSAGSAPVIVPRVQSAGTRLADVRFTPQAGFIPAGSYSKKCIAVFRVSDGSLTANSGSVTFEAQNRAPVAAAWVLPVAATAFDTLLCDTGGAVDPDGDALTFQYRWRWNGAVVTGETASLLLPGRVLNGTRPFRAGDTMSCEVTARDGRKESDGATDTSHALWSANVTLANSRPQIVVSLPSVSTYPGVAAASPLFTSTDDDGDVLTLSLCDGVACPNVDTSCAGETFTLTSSGQAGNTRQASLAWTPTSTAISVGQNSQQCVVIVRASDGMDPVPACAVSASTHRLSPAFQPGCSEVVFTVQNRAPLATAPSVCAGATCVAPTLFNDTADVTCSVNAASDPDGDPLTAANFRWMRNGSLVVGATSAVLPSTQFDTGDRLACGATMADNHTAQTVSLLSGEVTVANRAPTASAAVTPASPNKGSTLTCVTTGSADADNNGGHRVQTLTYAFAWELKPPAGSFSAISGQTGATLSPAHFDVGDEVRCKVQASDGVATSSWTTAASVEIVNRAPTLTISSTSVTTNPTVASAGVTLTATDADGDNISIVEVSDGCSALVPAPVLESQVGVRRRASVTFMPPAGFIPGGQTTRTCTVQYKASDGRAVNSDSAVVSLDFVVNNRKPVMASTTTVQVGTGDILVGTSLRCSGSATDADGDTVQYTCAWFRSNDGVAGWTQISGTSQSCTPGGAGADYVITPNESHKYVRCNLTPNDTHEDGLVMASTNNHPIVNSNPNAFNATMSAAPLPAKVKAAVFTCDAPVLPTPLDADLDTVTYTYKWLVSSDGSTWTTTNRTCPGPGYSLVNFPVPAPSPVPLSAPSPQTWTPCGEDSHKYVTCTWLASDAYGGVTAAVTPAPVQLTNTAPVLAAVSAKTASEGSLLSFALSATDVDLDTLTYTLDSCTPPAPFAAGDCAGIAVNSSSGAVTWTPGYSQSGATATGIYNLTFLVSDGHGGSHTQSTTVDVNHTNRQPGAFTASLGYTNLRMGQTVTCDGTSVDPDNDGAHPFANAGANLTYTYQWKWGNTAGTVSNNVASCSGATASTLTLCKEVAHKYLSCDKRATDDGSAPLYRDATPATATLVDNTAPVLTDPVDPSVSEASPLSIAISALDVDMDAQTFSLASCTPPAGGLCPSNAVGMGNYQIGTVTCGNQTGPDRKECSATFSWTPSYTQSGSTAQGVYALTFQAADGQGGTHSQSVNVTVNHTNRAPLPFATTSSSSNWKVASAATCSGTTTDPDNDGSHGFANAGKNLTHSYGWKKSTTSSGPWSDVACSSVPSTGVLTLCASDAHMWLTCAATATDDGAAPLATVSSTPAPVQQANSLPVAGSHTVSGTEDTQVVVTVTRSGTPGYTDADGDDAVSFEAAVATGGSLVATSGTCSAGSCDIRLNPTADLFGVGAAGFDYRVNDGYGWSGWGHITIDLTGTPDNPVLANPGNQTIAEGSLLQVNLSASDVDGNDQTFAVSSCTPPTGGSCSGYSVTNLSCSGTVPRNCTAKIQWTPGYSQAGSQLAGVYSWDVRTDDGTGRTHTRTISVTVNHTNRAPSAFSASLSAGATWKVGDSLTCDGTTTDPDDDGNHLFANAGKNITYAYQWKMANDAGGTGEVNATCPGATSATMTLCSANAHKYLTCVKSADDDGSQPDNAPVVATNPARIQMQNTAPTLSNPGDKSVNEGVALSFNVVADDLDLDATTLTLDACTPPAGGSCPTAGVSQGQYSLGAPSCVITGTPTNQCTSAFSWTPSYTQAGSQASGVYSLTFKAADGLGGFDSKVIQVTVNHINRPPNAFSATLGQGATWKVGDTLSCDGTTTDPDATGHPFANAGANLTYTYQWKKADNAGGSGEVNAACSGNTSATLTLCASDAHKYLTCQKWADDDGINPNGAPVAASVPARIQMQNSAPAAFTPTLNPAVLKATIASSCDGTTTDADGDTLLPYTYQWQRSTDGVSYSNISGATSQSWSPGKSDRGKFIKCLKTASDGTATAVGSVVAVVDNTAPTWVAPGAQSATEGTTLNVTLDVSDLDGETAAFSLLSCTPPTGGTCPSSGGGLGNYSIGSVSTEELLSPDRTRSYATFSWQPNYTQSGSQAAGVYTLTFRANDGFAGLTDQVVSVTVNHVNRAPVAFTSSVGTGATWKVGDALACNGTTTDPDGDDGAHGWIGGGTPGTGISSYTYQWLSSTTVGGTYTNTTCAGGTNANLTLCMAESHRYFKCQKTAWDNASTSLSTVSSLGAAVQAQNTAPTWVNPGAQSINEGSTLSFTVDASDLDADTLSFSVQACTPPTGGTCPSNGGGLGNYSIGSVSTQTLTSPDRKRSYATFSWQPNYTQSGSQAAGNYLLTLRASDGNGATADQAVTVTVNHVNRSPNAFAGLLSYTTTSVGDVLTCTGTTTDPDAGDPYMGGTLSYSWQWYVSSNSGGPFSTPSACLGNNTASMTLCSTESHKYFTCTKTAMDNNVPPASTDSSQPVAVQATNTVPAVTGATLNINEDTATLVTISNGGANPKYTDADGDNALIGAGGVATQNATNGAVSGASCAGDGTCTLTFTPTLNFYGTASFQFKIVDSYSGSSGWATVTVNVAAVNDAPTATSVPTITGTLQKGNTLTCNEAAAGFADVDSTLTYSYKWFKAPDAVTPIATTKTLADSNFAHGDSLTCEATASDGEYSLSRLSSSAIILNTAPNLGSATVSFQESPIYETTTLHCQISGASDIDGDGLTYEYRFFKNGNSASPIQAWSASNTLSPAVSQRVAGDAMQCSARASDGLGGLTAKDSGSSTVQAAISLAWGSAPTIGINASQCRLDVAGTSTINTASCDYWSSGTASASVGSPFTGGVATASSSDFFSNLSLDNGAAVRAGGTFSTTWTVNGRVAGGANSAIASTQISRTLTLSRFLAGTEYSLLQLMPAATVAGNVSEGMEVAPDNSNANRCTWCLGNRGALSVGGGHVCAIVTSGGNDTIQCWGKNNNGQLGNNSTTSSNTPVNVQSSAGTTWSVAAGGIVALSASDAYTAVGLAQSGYTCAVESSGKARCWGFNGRAQLGQGASDTTDLLLANKRVCASSANCNSGDGSGELANVVAVSATGQAHDNLDANSAGHACFLLSNGRVRCVGRGYNGEAGDDTSGVSMYGLADTDFMKASGTPITDALAVTGGAQHTCVLVDEGNNYKVRCAGLNTNYPLGTRDSAQRQTAYTPVWWDNGGNQPNTELSGVRAISAGAMFTCALLDDSRVVCWGRNNSGQLGDNTTVSRYGAVWVCDAATDCNSTANFGNRLTGAVQIAVGFEHACALMWDNRVQCWGKNDLGQLGDGTTTSRSYAQPTHASYERYFRSLSAGGKTTCGLVAESSDGTSKITCWGEGTSGQMGDNAATSSNYPNRYPSGGSNVRSQSCGVYSVSP